MSNHNSIFICSNCDAQFQKWVGRCLECGSWGTIAESVSNISKVVEKKITPFDSNKLLFLDPAQPNNTASQKLSTHLHDFDELLGGGIVHGSLVLLGGEPGIGKSTLVLQLLNGIILDQNSPGNTVFYASGEETLEQVTSRAKRLHCNTQRLHFLPTTDIDETIAALIATHPKLAVIDSIQTMKTQDAPGEVGSVTQIKALTSKLLETAKKTSIPIILIGHVTKDGSVAGPKTLEHLVDTVLYIEGDTTHDLRILRATKNRFGPTNETAIFQMTEDGLVSVENPSALFLADRPQGTPGSVITCVMEGQHPLLVEVQALVNRTVFGYPQRRASGFELNRLQVLIAVLTKRAGLALESYDIHLNIVGGITINESSADIAVALAIASAFLDKAVSDKLVAFGEIGLGGELRSVRSLDKRLSEINKMGFTSVILPRLSKKIDNELQLLESSNISQAISLARLSSHS